MKVAGIELPDECVIVDGKIFVLVEDKGDQRCADRCKLYNICKTQDDCLCLFFDEKCTLHYELWKPKETNV